VLALFDGPASISDPTSLLDSQGELVKLSIQYKLVGKKAYHHNQQKDKRGKCRLAKF
jgi:hypothetical protein